ncbi:hypothetical protein BGZ57DRAFT_853387 [Hyaloscypha finlandica]|nr:hypothetical protein BGZ57DRAFT_853387 [Hyaloscypha finlandica]
MSARIRHSSLLLRKYDWSFCECINVQRRGLNINGVVSKNHKPKANSTPEVNRVAVDPTSAKPVGTRLDAVLSSTLSASTLRVATAQGKPTKRKRSQGLRILRKVPTGPSNGIRIIRVTTDVSTAPKPLVRRANSTKRSRGLIIKAQSKSTEPTATGLFSSETGTQYTISRRYKGTTPFKASAEEWLQDLTSAERVTPKSVNKQSQTVRFRKVPADSNLSIEYARVQAFHKMNFNRLEDRPLVRRVSRLSITKIYPAAPERPIPRGRLRRIKPLRIRKFLSTSATDQPIVSEKAREMAQELHQSKLESIAATQPEVFPSRVFSPAEAKIIKYDSLRVRKYTSLDIGEQTAQQPEQPAEVKIIKFDSLRVRKHVIPLQTFRKVNEHVKARKVNTSIDIREQTAQQFEQEAKDGRAIGFEDIPKGVQPLVIKRPQNIVVQKVPTSPNQPVEPQSGVQDSPLIRRFVSSSVYPIPTEEMKNLAALAPERDSIEQPEPTNIEHWNPSERIERAIESAAAKRLQRDSWLTRKGDVRLAISLLFSPRSLNDVKRLRRMYNPNKGEFGRFKIFRRLEVGNYTEYNRMLASFAQSWKPFDMKLNEPVHFTKKSRYRVGFQLDLGQIEQLERSLLESVKSLPCTANVGWSNTRDNDEHSVMVINEHIKEAEEAIHLMELLDLEHKGGLQNIRVEGLVLHGYLPGEDSLFPPPEEFRFPGAEHRIARIPAGFSQVSQLEI